MMLGASSYRQIVTWRAVARQYLIYVMNRLLFICLFFCTVAAAWAQGSVRGKIKDKQTDEPMGYVNVIVSPQGATTVTGGAITDENGDFHIQGLAMGNYTLRITYVGYKDEVRDFRVTTAKPHAHFSQIFREKITLTS